MSPRSHATQTPFNSAIKTMHPNHCQSMGIGVLWMWVGLNSAIQRRLVIQTGRTKAKSCIYTTKHAVCLSFLSNRAPITSIAAMNCHSALNGDHRIICYADALSLRRNKTAPATATQVQHHPAPAASNPQPSHTLNICALWPKHMAIQSGRVVDHCSCITSAPAL